MRIVDYETAADRDAHVVPVNDDGITTDHASASDCWCQPTIDWQNPATGGRVYVHRRYLDGRVIETGRTGVIATNVDQGPIQ